MHQQFLRSFVLISLFAIIFSFNSCDKNDSPSVDKPLYGHWVKEFQDENTTYTARMVFYENGSYLWVLPEPVEGHSASGAYVTVSESEFTITSDSDCGTTTGVYGYSISGEKLTIVLVNEECEGREHALEGEWLWKNSDGVNPVMFEHLVANIWLVESSEIDGNVLEEPTTNARWINITPDLHFISSTGQLEVPMSKVSATEFRLDNFANGGEPDLVMEIQLIDADNLTAKYSAVVSDFTSTFVYRALKD